MTIYTYCLAEAGALLAQGNIWRETDQRYQEGRSLPLLTSSKQVRMEDEASNIHVSWNLQYQVNSWVTSHTLKIRQPELIYLYCFRIRDMALMAVWLVYVPYSLGFLEAYWLKAAIHSYNTY